jgi:hypothetical protein
MQIHLIVKALAAALLAVAALPATAKGVADEAMSRFVMPCDRAGTSDAVYQCALGKAASAGVVSAGVVQGCRNEIGSAAADVGQQMWHCARLRQFGAKMSSKEWYDATARNCDFRARSPGHRYAGKRNDCIADAITDSRRVPDAAVAECRARPHIEKNHRLLNCLVDSLRGKKSAAATAATSVKPGFAVLELMLVADVERHGQNACRAYAAQSQMDEKQRRRFVKDCGITRTSMPMSEIEKRFHDGTPQAQERRAQDNIPATQQQAPVNVLPQCENYNRSGALRLDCACMAGEANRQLAAGKLTAKNAARMEFDPSPCIDRPRTADQWVAREFTPGTTSMMRNAGVDVEGLKSCHRRAIAETMPRAALRSFETIRTEMTHLCSSRKR